MPLQDANPTPSFGGFGLRSIGIDYGYGVAKEVPKGETWA